MKNNSIAHLVRPSTVADPRRQDLAEVRISEGRGGR